MRVSFFVPGVPAPGGSKKAYCVPGQNRIRVVDDAMGNSAWRASVAQHAHVAMGLRPPLRGPLHVDFEFTRCRPQGHFGTGRNAGIVKPTAPEYPAVRPDLTKLIRAAEDACTGIVWADDASICVQGARKCYTTGTPGVRITIITIGGIGDV